MSYEKESVSADQGSQPTLGSLQIGIIAVAKHDGVAKARLLLRPASGDQAVTLTEGASLAVPGHGVLTLDQVSTDEGGRVSLTLAPATND